MADRNRLALVDWAPRQRVIAARDGRFGRAVQVGELRVGDPAHPVDQGGRRDHLAAPHHPAQAREVALGDDIEFRHHIEDRGRREPLREPGFANELRELVRQEIQFGRH